jgi:hypothetical protein
MSVAQMFLAAGLVLEKERGTRGFGSAMALNTWFGARCVMPVVSCHWSLVISYWHEATDWRGWQAVGALVPGFAPSLYAEVDHGRPKEPKKTMRRHILRPRNGFNWLIRSCFQTKC